MVRLDIDGTNLPYQPERVSEWKKKGDCFPLYVEIGPTNRCNHRCIFCALDWVKHGKIDINKKILIRNLKDMIRGGVKSVMFAGEGEPVLHKNLTDFVWTASNYGASVSITTNGSIFNKDLAEKIMPYLTWIRFSVDAGSSETYSKIHGTNKEDFRRTIKNIEYAVKLKNEKANVSVQTLVLPQNIHEISKLAKILLEIGVDMLQVKPYSYHPLSSNNFYVNLKEYELLDKELKVFNSPNFKIKVRKKTLERILKGIDYLQCYALPFFALIDAKGNLIPCNLFYDNENFIYGNLYKEKFSKIWRGKKRRMVLEKLREGGLENCRKGCRLDASNRYLDSIINRGEFQNFL